MLALTLAAALLTQGPDGEDGATGGRAPARDAIAVEGTIELTRSEAKTSALRRARDEHRVRIHERGEELAAGVAAFWLPEFVVRREVERWARSRHRAEPLRVLDSETVEHRFSYGNAYRTTLSVASEGARDAADGDRLLERRLAAAGRLFLAKCGAIAAFWGVLAFLQYWFDRLSRGYMTWRLRLLALSLGLVLPPVLLLL